MAKDTQIVICTDTGGPTILSQDALQTIDFHLTLVWSLLRQDTYMSSRLYKSLSSGSS